MTGREGGVEEFKEEEEEEEEEEEGTSRPRTRRRVRPLVSSLGAKATVLESDSTGPLDPAGG